MGSAGTHTPPARQTRACSVPTAPSTSARTAARWSWRAAEMTNASIQRFDHEGGAAEIICTEIEGIALNGPNDLVFGANGWLYFTDPGTYRPADPEPSYIFGIDPSGTRPCRARIRDPVFPNGIAVEDDGSVVWDESYTGHVGRLRPDGTPRGPGPPARCEPDPRRHEDRRRRPPVRHGYHGRRHPRAPAGRQGRRFIKVGNAATNCAFSGETLWVTDATVLAASTEPNLSGQLWRLTIPGGGAPTAAGSIAGGQ